jgi:hypothetical protein
MHSKSKQKNINFRVESVKNKTDFNGLHNNVCQGIYVNFVHKRLIGGNLFCISKFIDLLFELFPLYKVIFYLCKDKNYKI